MMFPGRRYSPSALTVVTNDLTLCKGVWLILGRVPVASVNNSYTFRVGSGTTDINAQNYFWSAPSYGIGAILITVTSATATVRLLTGGSASTNFSDTDRGGLQAIRLR